MAELKPEEPTRSVFTAESLKKKFRLSEYLAEKLISGVAFLSITIIVLIFIFVFRESFPLFNTSKAKVRPVAEQVSPADSAITEGELQPETYGTEERPEVYGSETSADETGQRPEVYGGAAEEGSLASEARPEVYGSEAVTEITAEEGRPQSYTGADDTSAEPAYISAESSQSSSYDEEVIRHTENKEALKTLSSNDWLPVSTNPRYGLWPLLLGTFKVTIIAMLFAAPLGILAALFTSAFAPVWLREILKPAIELLAGFPSVVIGFFALMVMASLFQDFFGYDSRLNAFVGGIAMALAAIPIIFTITEDALSAVPSTYKEASLALGATKWETAFFVTLPAATPGIFASVLLGTGRVFGETMIALMATGNAAMSNANPFDSVRTLAATIGAEMAEVVYGDTHYSVLFLIGSLLFIFTFISNSFAEFYVKGKLMKRIMGK
ncbi:MAG: phosphate ABC transporter permease subunit PstC [Bacteroidales bacterium]